MANKSKELLLDNNNMLYNQNQQIENIVTTLAQTNQTAAIVQEKLLDQGEKIVGIANTNKDIQRETRRVDKQTNQIIRREFYMKLILYLIALLLFAANIIVLAIKLSND
ncbi:unnamed protein product (macronuclear) [Paramecium tetraurelia]|uniref:Chromosome undetermined scaffold_138, whole genome shotgun sequence n=1 Tax=Paramecium tetraurelia TaxID=5888 RepID=A0BZ00_PARTE|nr:uncharacterized protein GSPATT00033620001 [Paramecium tetraurelia]XP_001441661.1 uncharacterized protein GSPATT00038998001 [Paramecium tetraurelia]CAK63767.1 unnamed protein product [Paramecium tetraurelia]CAK74264.1 unnamed protein product [Paramecium tetraurelia]|eukprot:XP_001431165.1 hypothetical protein (macronuclear) [Paramecium tetraurelia strain d4-2]